MTSSEDYTPVDCNFYDYLEEAATLKKKCVFLLNDKGNLRIENGQIVDLFIENKVEFLKLKKGMVIRLDMIHQFNDIDISSGKPCKIG